MSIVFEQVSFSYQPLTKRQRKAGEKQRYALKNISFELHDKEFLAIAGHTGSGKSTLVQHLNGLENPTEGRVLWRGEDVAQRSVATRAREDIGVVFQYPEHQLFAATVYEDVAFGPRNLGLGQDDVDARVKEAIASVHLDFDELKDRSPFELSGGQQRRVAFAGVLAMRPSVLVLDEPESNLDFKNQLLVLDTIEDLARSGLTCIFNTHFPAHALRRANQALLLGRGGKSVCGKTCEVVTEDRISEFFGVRAVIGEMQTPLGVYQDVIPVSIGCTE